MLARAAGLLLTTSMLIGCGDSARGDLSLPRGWAEKVPGDIYLAGLFSYTGTWTSGEDKERGAVTAIKEINAQGGIDGKRIGLLIADDRGDRTTGTGFLQALIDARQVGAVIGPSRSIVMVGNGSESNPGVAQLAASAGVVIVSPSATSPVISDLQDDGFVFRTCPSDDVQALALAKVAIREGFNRVFIAQTAGDAATIGIRKVFSANFGAAKGENSTAFYEFASTQTNYVQEILAHAKAKWAPQTPDAIVLATFAADGAAIINAASTFDWGAGTTPPRWLLADGSKDNTLITSLSNPNLLGDGNVFGVVPAAQTGTDYDTFAAAYQQLYGTAPGNYVANAYDAAYLVAGAMQLSADPLNGEELKINILKTGPVMDAPPARQFHPGQWAEMAAELKAMGAVDYQGASGPVDFNTKGNVFSDILEWTVKDRAIQFRPGKCWTPEGTPDC